MFPLRDSIQARRFPGVTIAVIVVNLAVFVHEVLLGAAAEPFVVQHAVVPARLLAAVAGDPRLDVTAQGLTVLTSMFMHGDVLHFLGNMWFLWIFGDNVEDRFGHVGFLGFYLACGVAAAVSQVLLAPASAVPMIGASGAIAGVLGAYLRFYPSARVLSLVPIFVFVQLIEIPALVFLGLWFVVQILSSLSGMPGVAWWAHIAGFVAGLALSFLAAARADVQLRPPPRGRTIRVRRS